jgi:tyrosyl-tRNA synthetase
MPVILSLVFFIPRFRAVYYSRHGCLLKSDSKIDLLDPPDVIAKKIRKAVAIPQVTDENGILALVEFVLLPAAALKGCKEFRVERTDGLEPLVYTSIKQMHDDYKNDVVCACLALLRVSTGR